jgi:hypothetical protein
MDLKNPVGTIADFWVFDPVNSVVDPVYDVGSGFIDGAAGKVWFGPYKIPIIRALITQGDGQMNQLGYYNTDSLHLTLNSNDIEKILPNIMKNPDDINRGRFVWKNEVWRPFKTQQAGVISEGYLLMSIDCIQVMSDELIVDPQFTNYDGRTPPTIPVPTITGVLDGGSPETVDFTSLTYVSNDGP